MASDKVRWEELTSLQLTLGYFHRYRYLRSKMLEHDLDTVEEIFSDLRDEQQESIKCMLQVDLVVNAVLYSQDLAAILLCLDKPLSKFTTMISSLHETGSGSIKEFYEKLFERQFDFFWKIMKYDELKLHDKPEQEKYERSCNRFRKDMLKVSKFFLQWYNLFSAYKHGLNVVPVRETKTARDVLMLGNPDGTFDMFIVSPSWYLGYIEVVEIVHNVFNRLIEPIMWKLLANVAKVDLKGEETITKLLTSDLSEEEKKRRKKFTFNIVYPWRIREAQEPKPFY